MQIELWQIILLSLLGFYGIVENLGISVLGNQALIMGTLTGLIMGDVKTGLAVGATLQLMGLGVQAYGGASVPDYMTASIVGTAFAISSGKGAEFGIGLAIPVALLMIQLDILARFGNVFLQKKISSSVDTLNFKRLQRFHLLGIFTWGLSRGLPIFIVFIFGEQLVAFISKIIPSWLTEGLSVAGGMLPAVGIAILLRYLPAKQFLGYLIIGFIGVAYLKIPMFGIALLGLALAILQFNNVMNMNNRSIVQTPAVTIGGLSEDEYED